MEPKGPAQADPRLHPAIPDRLKQLVSEADGSGMRTTAGREKTRASAQAHAMRKTTTHTTTRSARRREEA